MIKYQVPATTANLGIGFDCLGMALNIYDYFEVEYNDAFNLDSKLGYGSAIAYSLFVIIMLFSIVGFKITGRGEKKS